MDTTREYIVYDGEVSGDCVIYVMARDQRVQDNYALLHTQECALTHKLPLIVVFDLLAHTGVRAYEHYQFMLDGLREVKRNLSKLDITFVMTHRRGATLRQFLLEQKPAAIYFDFSPLTGTRDRTKRIARQLDVRTVVVDTHNIVPVWVASDKQEFAAHTMRRKLHKQLEKYLVEPPHLKRHPHKATVARTTKTISFEDAEQIIKKIDRAGIDHGLTSGETAAHSQLKSFLEDKLASYAYARNDITTDGQSDLSPYLHFGQLSSLRIALETLYETDARPLLFDVAKMAQADDTISQESGMNALFEEMIVRKELSDNFCFYSTSYTSLAGAPVWARQTLNRHRNDPREYQYTKNELEQAKTHDQAWNAAQKQLTATGKMHGYMRMYWAKKLLEWSDTPEQAVEHALYLNDHYSIDGGDPNGYVGILWSIAGLHDRPWTERKIFGKIRYMNEAGLRRKFDVDRYIDMYCGESPAQ